MKEAAKGLLALVLVSYRLLLVYAGDDDFKVTSSAEGKGIACTYTVKIEGKGVYDSFKMPCSSRRGALKIGNDKFAMFTSPSEAQSFYTNTANTLVIVKGPTCTKRTYKTKYGKTEFKETKMWSMACDKIKDKIEAAKKTAASAPKDPWAYLANSILEGGLDY